jgi:hypothetical protein
MVHSEQMHALDGPIRIGQSIASGGRQVENRANMALHSACVVRRPTAEEEKDTGRKLEGFWIGDMLPGGSISLPKRLPADKTSFVAERAAEAKSARAPRLNLEPMFKLALDPRYMEPGEMRLVARVDEVLPGETIVPAASQIRGATLIVAHLEYPPLAIPRRDANTRQDVKAREDDEQPEALFN